MGFLDRLRRKKKKEEAKKEEAKKGEKTDLEILCADDREAYEALYQTMPLDPRNIKESIEEAAEKAKNFKKSGDLIEARAWYETAGRLAIYQGNVAKVKQYFGECKKLFPNTDYPILEIPERAVKKAQEYYQKHLKEEKGEK